MNAILPHQKVLSRSKISNPDLNSILPILQQGSRLEGRKSLQGQDLGFKHLNYLTSFFKLEVP